MILQCDGPGPHIPADGVLGQSSQPITGMRCSATACAPTRPLAAQNNDLLQQRAAAALTANATFIALAAPTNAQIVAQVQRLTKQVNALIRMDLALLTDVSDTV